MTIVDVSYFNRPVPWPALRSAGVTCVIVRGPLGADGADWDFAANWAQAKTFPRQGIYGTVNRTQSAAAHVTNYLKVCGGDYGTEPLALDVERTNAERAAIAAGTLVWDKVAYTALLRSMLLALAAHTRDKVYTSKVEWEAMTTSPDWGRELDNWIAHYNDHISAPDVPAGWTWRMWQYGQQLFNGKPIDVNRENVKPMTVPIVTHGPKLGIHSINPGDTLKLVKQAVAHGWRWPVVKLVNDASPLVDVKALSPQTITICRYINSNPEWESLNNVGSWPQAKREQFARESIAFLLGRTNAAQLAAVDYWGVVNEPNPRDEVNGYNGIGLALIELVKEAERHNLKLALPAFPQGCPEWNQGAGALGGGMVELCNTGLFGLMKAGGHIYDCHEGVFTGQPVDFGYGDIIPRAPQVAGAGSTNFRHRYLYELLAQRGEVVPLVVSEFYGGGFYASPPADHLSRFAWYDVRARETPYLLAFLPFTINPDGTWQKEDYGPTYASDGLWAYIDTEKLKPNGDNEMQPLFHAKALVDLVLRDAAGQITTDPVATSPDGHVVGRGTTLHVYAANVTAGAFANRVTINPNGNNIWGVATAIQRV